MNGQQFLRQQSRITRRGALGLASCGAAVTLLGACGQKSASLRYRITVDVETPDGVRSGSSVIESRRVMGSRGLLRGIDTGSSRFFGEAAVVDLGGSRYLFALLISPIDGLDPNRLADRVFRYPELAPPISPESRETWLDAYREANTLMPATQLRRADYPALATFVDVAAPETVQFVDPDALNISFGAGYRLKRILFAVTNDIATPRVEKILGWLGQNPDERVDPGGLGTTNPSPRYWLTHGSFIMRPM
jgi:hypothetical protein